VTKDRQGSHWVDATVETLMRWSMKLKEKGLRGDGGTPLPSAVRAGNRELSSVASGILKENRGTGTREKKDVRGSAVILWKDSESLLYGGCFRGAKGGLTGGGLLKRKTHRREQERKGNCGWTVYPRKNS